MPFIPGGIFIGGGGGGGPPAGAGLGTTIVILSGSGISLSPPVFPTEIIPPGFGLPAYDPAAGAVGSCKSFFSTPISCIFLTSFFVANNAISSSLYIPSAFILSSICYSGTLIFISFGYLANTGSASNCSFFSSTGSMTLFASAVAAAWA